MAASTGFIDAAGSYAIPPRFDGAGDFSEGMASVLMIRPGGNGFGYIDKSGAIVIEPRYSEAGDFHGGLAKVRRGDSYAYVTRTGAVVPAGAL